MTYRICLECVYVDKNLTPPRNGISTGNFLISSPDLGSPPKFRLECYSFSNRSLKIVLLQIYFNITKLFVAIWKMEASFFSKQLSQSECRDNKNATTIWERRVLTQWKCSISRHTATQPMSMWYFQTKRKPHVTKAWHNADKHYLFRCLI